MTGVLGWWFAPSGSTVKEIRLPNCDDRVVVDGETLTVRREPILCLRGLHASEKALDAIRYARSSIVCRVEVSGKIELGYDKLCGTARKCLWRLDSDKILHEFACRCAEISLRIAGVTDERCWGAIAAKRQWLRGEITDKELAAARDEAWEAARDEARDAARDAARAAARAAARDAGAAEASDAARDAQLKKLLEMIEVAK